MNKHCNFAFSHSKIRAENLYSVFTTQNNCIDWFIDNQGYSNLHIEKCEMKFITYYKTNRRHDIDNGTPKFLLDGLSESGFIVDDDSKHITKLIMECYVDKENPRTEITVNVLN